MSVTVDLPDELLVALRVEAERRGISVEALIVESVSDRVRAPQPRRRFALAAIGASNGSRFARNADEMLAEGFGRD
jgi:plasmid stability protein